MGLMTLIHTEIPRIIGLKHSNYMVESITYYTCFLSSLDVQAVYLRKTRDLQGFFLNKALSLYTQFPYRSDCYLYPFKTWTAQPTKLNGKQRGVTQFIVTKSLILHSSLPLTVTIRLDLGLQR